MGLLGILALSFGAWFLSKLSGPKHESGETQHPQGDTSDTTRNGQNAESPLHVIIETVPPIPTPDKKRETRENDTQRRDKRRLCVEILTLCALCVYTVVNGGMWWATKTAAEAARDNADISKQALHIDQRAWIGVIVGRGPITNQQPITMPIRLINTGKTPALRVHGPIVVNLLREDEEPDFNYTSGHHPHYTVAGQDILTNLPQDLPFAVLPGHVEPSEPITQILVTEKIKKQIERGELYIVVHGEITYDDVFGVTHWTRFCNYAHNVVGFREKSVANTCGPYNDVDKDK
jgi:hypothetical protein